MTGKLTVKQVRTMKEPGRVGDGGGLWLQVRDADRKSWLFRYKLFGKARAMGLGPVEDVGLAEARDVARECRRLVREGIDPINHRRAKLAAAKTASGRLFKEVADAYITTHESAWRNQAHRGQWRTSLEQFVFPTLGETPVANIDTEEVLSVLQAIWTSRPETASRVRGRIEAILNFAKTKKMRTGENPARWRGHLKNLLPARSRAGQAHHRAMPYADVPAFMIDLGKQSSVGSLALRFLILTAGRTSEVVGARWDEIDLDKAFWIIPQTRMKAFAEHRVALSSAAIDVLKAAQAIGGKSDFVFPSIRDGHIVGTTMVHVLRRMKRDKDATIHGFRSSFADWCTDKTNYPPEMRELALAHKVGTAVEQAYRRTDMVERRARLMEDWGQYCTTIQPAAAGNVVPIGAGRA